MSIIPAVVAASVAAQMARRRREEENRRRREAEARRYRQQEEDRRRRDEERRKQEKERKRREDQIKKYREAERRHRMQEKGEQENFNILEEYNFTDVLTIKRDNLPKEVWFDDYEHKLADGTTYTKFKMGDYYYSKTYQIHTLTNGVKRTYLEGSDELALVREELPDGRSRNYKEGHITYERDAEGNYKCYELKDNEAVLIAEGKETTDTGTIEFSEIFTIGADTLSREVWFDGYEHKLADGTTYTKFKTEDYYYSKTYQIHTLTNGVKRTYLEGKDELTLICEELPDGRSRSYKEGHITYEHDAEGNYKCYELKDNEVVLVEEGDKNGKLRSYTYKNQTVTVTENTPEAEFITCDYDGRVIAEGNAITYKAYYTDGSIKEEKDEDGTIRKWHENGQLAEEKFADRHGCQWNSAGQKVREDFSEHEFCTWHDNGNLRMEYRGGCTIEWNETGQKIRETTPDKVEYRWYDDGSQKEVIDKDGSVTRWHQETGTISYQKKANGEFQEFDLLGRVVEEGDRQEKTTYEYYGDTENKRHVRVFDTCFGTKTEKSYTHYSPKGVEDTQTYLAMRAIAAERISKEDKLSKHLEGKRVILPKMSKVSKSIAMYKALQKVKKQK